MKTFRSLLIGDNALLTECGQVLLKQGCSIVAVATEARAVREWAVEHEIPVIDAGAGLAAQAVAFEFDWLFSIANLRVIPEEICTLASCDAINFHDGPLPDMAGLNTPSWSLLEGRETHGITWHAITLGIDAGDIHASQVLTISPEETVLSLNARCLSAGIATFSGLVEDIAAGRLARQEQDLTTRRYYARNDRPSAAGTLSFDAPAVELSRLVRALSFGTGYVNPLVTPKILTSTGPIGVASLTVLDDLQTGQPGEVLSVTGTKLVVATADRPVRIELDPTSSTIEGMSSIRPGDCLKSLEVSAKASLDNAMSVVVPHESTFRKWLSRATDIELPGLLPVDPSRPASLRSLPLPIGSDLAPEDRATYVLAFIARMAIRVPFDVWFTTGGLRAFCSEHPGYFAGDIPLRVDVDGTRTIAFVLEEIKATIAEANRRITYPSDLVARTPGLELPALSVGVCLDDGEGVAFPSGCALTFVIGQENRAVYDASRITGEQVSDLLARLELWSNGMRLDAEFASLPILTEAERQHLLFDLNATELAYDETACIHHLIRQQVDRTPDLPAVSFRGHSISYRELDERADRIAHVLAAQGAGPDVIIGLHLPRGIDLVVGAYAILKAGSAYLPLDPAFPVARLSLMVEDSATKLILTDRDHAAALSGGTAAMLTIEDVEAGKLAAGPFALAGGTNLAYVIYTSGSTGRPKGVMVEHRNVANFFAGMDERIPRSVIDAQDSWLAVTSLSFDISILEIFWTLARGFKLVMHASALVDAKSASANRPALSRALDFSLFYWGNDDGPGAQKYRALLEGAKFADQHGFQAIWTPERHFHAFGGPFPNPAVTGAAVAAVTSNLAIRAGSCVLPLHHPARVAEEWAIVDNLSGGRAGLAFASGWMPEDFVLRPENAPPNNKAALLSGIETVRRHWRGEAVDYDFDGRTVPVITQPRPVSRELPVWVTTAGNPDTYRDAARIGANVLTHLLGQSIEELAGKIEIYRMSLAEAGRKPADHKVTLMLHTLIGQDREDVRERAREPMKAYLKSAAALIKQYAWAFPAFKKPAGVTNPMDVDLQSLSPDEMDAILEFAFLRYFEDSGLFGTVEDALARVAQLEAIGVDEIACLIDFGLPSQSVLDALVPLAEVVAQARRSDMLREEVGVALADDILRERVTHMQCTPSMAGMFLSDPRDRAAMGTLQHLFIGGEALKRPLLVELQQATNATVHNMYGPTETTIWSSTIVARVNEDVVPLGMPIANTQLYVLDRMRQPVPIGTPGELFIGGDGVTRGYLNREELTQERFLSDPFRSGRMYRTGDLVAYSPDGQLRFLGRADNQVKIRGNRIELGEIEARIADIPGVREAVVTVREDQPGDQRIVAYLRTSRPISVDEVRSVLGNDLPDYMLPGYAVTMDVFPLTPNAKVDRNRLPRPVEVALSQSRGPSPEDALSSTGEQIVAEMFKRILGLATIGRNENFFALGGHSLLAIQMHRELKAGPAPALTITDLFRFPTVAGLAQHIAGKTDARGEFGKVAERAAVRRASMGARRQVMPDPSNVG